MQKQISKFSETVPFSAIYLIGTKYLPHDCSTARSPSYRYTPQMPILLKQSSFMILPENQGNFTTVLCFTSNKFKTIYHSQASVPFLLPLKTFETLWFPVFFTGNKKGHLSEMVNDKNVVYANNVYWHLRTLQT